ncbi:TetR/AcrR family transcriptional regulator [Demequina sp. B12]|uniref:TetR/AcrR family transcriptional regulator n=1 Tax=Demequina sp. B12 TaxID=2992757 RepID=UPI00237B2809|nr:TetR/AcrR family transcriptional regulator [Demequina sp. B12]MDE0572811.1 TetR/AcrR family transcriptional regulator [Demequina sp. B12]
MNDKLTTIQEESAEMGESVAERTYARGRATKAHILDVAMAQFAENGYRGSSLRDIAGRAGMSHPGLLYHYPTKEALLMAVLERRDQQDGEVNPVNGEDGIEALKSLVRSARLNENRPGVVELYAVVSAEATSKNHPARNFFIERYDNLVSRIEAAYRTAASQGQVRDGVDCAAAAQQAVAVMDGLQVQWLMGVRATPMSEVLKHHFEAHLTVTLDA